MTTIDAARRPYAVFRWVWGAFLTAGVTYAAVRSVTGDTIPWSLWLMTGSNGAMFAHHVLAPTTARRRDQFMALAVVLMMAAIVVDIARR